MKKACWKENKDKEEYNNKTVASMSSFRSVANSLLGLTNSNYVKEIFNYSSSTNEKYYQPDSSVLLFKNDCPEGYFSEIRLEQSIEHGNASCTIIAKMNDDTKKLPLSKLAKLSKESTIPNGSTVILTVMVRTILGIFKNSQRTKPQDQFLSNT